MTTATGTKVFTRLHGYGAANAVRQFPPGWLSHSFGRWRARWQGVSVPGHRRILSVLLTNGVT